MWFTIVISPAERMTLASSPLSSSARLSDIDCCERPWNTKQDQAQKTSEEGTRHEVKIKRVKERGNSDLAGKTKSRKNWRERGGRLAWKVVVGERNRFGTAPRANVKIRSCDIT